MKPEAIIFDVDGTIVNSETTEMLHRSFFGVTLNDFGENVKKHSTCAVTSFIS